jgi:hypothetical protein
LCTEDRIAPCQSGLRQQGLQQHDQACTKTQTPDTGIKARCGHKDQMQARRSP